jgi:Copper type II ascorbate-dependent monooxygenase, C-terminal domain
MGILAWTLLVALAAARSPAAKGGDVPTYYRDVAPILQKHCQDCHRPGQVAPFSLLSYDQARKRSSDIVAVTEDRLMPPWHASTSVGGPFRDARVLSDTEKKTLAAWAAASCPAGDLKDAPTPKSWSSEWALGPPDLVLEVKQAYSLGPSGRDEHRVFVIPSGLTEGKWVSAVDFRPGNPRIVHHVLAAFDVTGRAKSLDKADPLPGYKKFAGYGTLPSGLPFLPSGSLSGWAPGKLPNELPKGVGRYVPAGADILLQVHYHKSGKDESDRSAIGLYFAKGPIDKQLRAGIVMPARRGLLARPSLRIPAGDARYEIKGTWTAGFDAHLLSVIPHMHWLGKDFVLEAILPDGSRRALIKIDDWDFNWQGTYEFEKEVAVPKGTRIEMAAHFDNSKDNPRNPSKPPVEVHWGEQTTDEMCIGFLQLTRDDEKLGNSAPVRFRGEAGKNDGARGKD